MGIGGGQLFEAGWAGGGRLKLGSEDLPEGLMGLEKGEEAGTIWPWWAQRQWED